MIFGVYALRDIKSTFMHPCLDVDDTSALTNFSMSVKDTGSLPDAVKMHPTDFVFYRIGHYDSETGKITGHDPVKLIEVTDVLREEVSVPDELC